MVYGAGRGLWVPRQLSGEILCLGAASSRGVAGVRNADYNDPYRCAVVAVLFCFCMLFIRVLLKIKRKIVLFVVFCARSRACCRHSGCCRCQWISQRPSTRPKTRLYCTICTGCNMKGGHAAVQYAFPLDLFCSPPGGWGHRRCYLRVGIMGSLGPSSSSSSSPVPRRGVAGG